MEKDQLAVNGEADVKLDPATTELLCLAKSGKRVFGRACSGAAMADHRRRYPFEMSSRCYPLAAQRSLASGQGAGCFARAGKVAQIRSASRGKCRAVPAGTDYRQGAAALGGSWRLAPRSSPVC